MEQIRWTELAEKIPIAVAYHRMIYDENNSPLDYQFLYVNKSFEQATGLKKNTTVGMHFSDFFDVSSEKEFNWIQKYSDVVKNKEELRFYQFSKTLNKWFKVIAFAVNDTDFVTFFDDVTTEYNKQEQIDAFFDISTDLMCIVDREGRFKKINQAWEVELGYALSSLENKKFIELIDDEDARSTMKVMSELFEKGRVSKFVNRYKTVDGEIVYLEWEATLYKDDIFGVARNITKQVIENELIIEENKRLEVIMAGTPDGYWDWDVTSGNLYLSASWKRQLGYADDELEDNIETFKSLIYEEDLEPVFENVQAYFNGSVNTYDMQFRMKHKAGHLVWIRSRGEVIRNVNNDPIRMTGTHIDITNEKLQEKRILEKEENFRNFFDSTEDMLLVCDLNFDIKYVNQVCIRKLKYDFDEFISLNLLDLSHEKWRKETEIIYEDILEGKQSACPSPLVSKKKEKISVETKLWHGKWNGQDSIFVLIKDLSLELAALDKFHKSFYSNPALMAITDYESNQFMEVNDMFINRLGYTRNELLGKTADDFNIFIDPIAEKYVRQKLRDEGRISNVELQVRHKDGSILTGLFSGEMIDNQMEKSFLTVMVDITELKNIQSELIKKDRLLTAVAESTKMLISQYDFNSALENCLELIGSATDVDRVYVFRNYYNDETEPVTSQVLEWNSGYFKPQMESDDLQNIPFSDLTEIMDILKDNKSILSIVSDLDESIQKHMAPQDILSLMVIPLFIEDLFWGFIGFDECKYEREWNDIEYSLLLTFANALESAIEHQMMVEKLELEKVKAEKANLAKSQFLANMSHEIRTPINGLMGMMALLEFTPLNDEQRNYLMEAHHASEILLYLVNDILDISKIEAGKMTLDFSEFDLLSCINESVLLFKEQFKAKGIQFSVHYHSSLPLLVTGDANRVKQILNNLIGNAYKFTHEGFVSMSVTAIGDNRIQFRIADTGIGMTVETIEKVFQPFEQGDASTTRHYGGTGLGLAITSEIVRMMNGHIHVSSVLGEGTEFTFDIQFTSFNRNDDVDYILKTAFKHHRILLIDTSETMKVYIDNYIGRYDVEVLHATSGEAALVVLLENKSKVDLVLVDYYLQDMNAETLFNTIRAIPSSSHIPMFLIGGHIKDDSKSKFEGYLSKPLNPPELYDKIRQSFLDMNLESLEEDSSQDVTEDEKDFRVLIAEDNEVNRRFMEILFKKHGYECDLVCDGIEALEAYKKQKYDMIFMDCQMPIMDGYKATEEIRSLEDENEHILIVAMTAYAMEGDAEKCFASGMDMYVSKPVDQVRIKEIIEAKMKERY